MRNTEEEEKEEKSASQFKKKILKKEEQPEIRSVPRTTSTTFLALSRPN